MKASSEYIGNELELFAHAKQWKSYWAEKVIPYLGDKVLEVGAGIGSNTQFLLSKKPTINRWVCLEPDKTLSSQILGKIDVNQSPKVEVLSKYLSEIKSNEKFDSILYIDVIEHIERDAEELALAKTFLNDGGYLIILVPAHQFLYSDFDKAIGHFRRYSRTTLKDTVGNGLENESLLYLDSIGIGASTFNKLFLKQTYPTLKQIHFWDSIIVSISRFTDVLLFYQIGKSLLGVWKK